MDPELGASALGLLLTGLTRRRASALHSTVHSHTLMGNTDAKLVAGRGTFAPLLVTVVSGGGAPSLENRGCCVLEKACAARKRGASMMLRMASCGVASYFNATCVWLLICAAVKLGRSVHDLLPSPMRRALTLL